MIYMNPIKKVRDITGLTQEELANHLGVSRQTIINYERDPSAIPLNILSKIKDIFGISIEELARDESRKMPSPKLTPIYESKRQELDGYISRLNNVLSIPYFNPKNSDYECNEVKSLIDDIKKKAEFYGRKPIIAAFGLPNSGKSTLLNYLIGEEIAPTDYQPFTSALTYFRHVSEKPDYLNSVDDATVTLVENGKPVIRYGHHNEVLLSYGTREGAYYKQDGIELKQIDVYLDNDLLREFTYLDLPGFGSERTEEDISLMQDINDIDYIFFLSSANVFLTTGAEITTLKRFISLKSDLNSISILATHSDIIGNPQKMADICDKAHSRLIDSMPDNVKKIFEDKNMSDKLRSRFRDMDNNNLKSCREFNKHFAESVEYVIKTKYFKLYKIMAIECKHLLNFCKDRIRQYQSTQPQAALSEEEQQNFENGLRVKISQISNLLNEVIKSCVKNSLEKWDNIYFGIINESFIVSKIDQKNIGNNKKDKELFSSYLSDELSDRLNKVMKDESERFSDELNSQLSGMSEWSKQYSFESNIDINLNGFDFQRAFATGLTGAGVFGALACWAAIVAGGSNLGAYILCAKVVSALSALGISLGGTAAVNAAIAAIGGPVTVGVALAVLAAGAIFGIFSGTWKKRFAKELIKQYGQYYNEYCDYIEKYWNIDTKKSLDECLNSMKDQFTEHYKNQLRIAKLTDKELEKTKEKMSRIYNDVINFASEMIKDIDNLNS